MRSGNRLDKELLAWLSLTLFAFAGGMFTVVIAFDLFNGRRISLIDYGVVGIIVLDSILGIRLVRRSRRLRRLITEHA